MERPRENAGYATWVMFLLYAARMLRRAKLTQEADSVKAQALATLELGRAWENRSFETQEAGADRVGSDQTLDGLASDFRARLGGRSADAMKLEPYVLIFPDNVDYYTQSPVAEQLVRYGQLRDRVVNHLAEDDVLRVEIVPKLEDGLEEYQRMDQALTTARNAQDDARIALERSITTCGQCMESTHGLLEQKFGKKKAEQFFPRR